MYTTPWNLSTESQLSEIKSDNSTATNLNDSSLERTIEVIILSVISLIALMGNVSVCLVVIKTMDLRRASNSLVLCLATADILVATFNMPMMIVTIATGDWMFSNEACVATGFIGMTLLIASVLSLAAISVDRYNIICHVAKFQQKKKSTAIMIIGVWVFSLLLASPPLFGWAEYGYRPRQSVCFCLWTASVSYTFFMVGACFGLPCIVMSCCYIRVLWTVKKSRQRIEAMDTNTKQISILEMPNLTNHLTFPVNHDTLPSVHHDEITVMENEINTKDVNSMPKESLTPCDPRIPGLEIMQHRTKKKVKKKREEIRFTLSLVVVVFVFIICWLPYCIEMFYSVFSNQSTPRSVALLTQLLGYLNSGINPILYGALNKQFRDGYSKIYRPLLNRCHC
ncbi:unnamed protein product [Owenia fusiformis]|uniref:Uncharacterized protein n=1 Tax=Owenia fusiformis TaxID=6347 RepID=A0A8J1TMA3_OWEFU|nr:unnamed protein product [Owenia fusiformis]